MNAASTPTTTERLLGLLVMTGAMMVLSALPAGAVLSLLEHFKFGTDWYWSVMKGAVIAMAIADVGSGLFCSARFAFQRRRKSQ